MKNDNIMIYSWEEKKNYFTYLHGHTCNFAYANPKWVHLHYILEKKKLSF